MSIKHGDLRLQQILPDKCILLKLQLSLVLRETRCNSIRVLLQSKGNIDIVRSDVDSESDYVSESTILSTHCVESILL